MGRIFEVRKSKMFARYDKMAKGFTPNWLKKLLLP
jgi:hypothetical protein